MGLAQQTMSLGTLISRVLIPQGQAWDRWSWETCLRAVVLIPWGEQPHTSSKSLEHSWEGAPHHTEGTSESTKIGALFLRFHK
jgi:hypothetical protein